jgi:hypothetical protein
MRTCMHLCVSVHVYVCMMAHMYTHIVCRGIMAFNIKVTTREAVPNISTNNPSNLYRMNPILDIFIRNFIPIGC